MRRIFEIIRPHMRRMLLGGGASLVVSALNGAMAWLVKPAVDNVFVRGEKGHLLLISAAVFVVFILRGIFEYLQNYLMKSVGAKIVRDFRDRLYAHMMHLPLSHYGRDSSGAMLSRLINDTAQLQELVAYRVRDLFVSSGTIVFLTALAFWRRWDLALISFTILPLAFYAVGRLGRRLRKISLRAQEKMAGITESASEGLSGIKIIKSFLMEEKEGGDFREKNRGYYREFMRGTRIVEATTLIMDFVAGAGIALIIFYGGTLVSGGVMTAGDFFSFLTAVFLIYTPAKRLAQVNNGFQQARASIERIDEVLLKAGEPGGDVGLEDFKDSIEFEKVSFAYEGKNEDALRDVSLKVNKGEIVALVGRSGAGKTTFVDLVAGFYRPQSGRILIDGIETANLTLESLRSKIGIVGQEVVLFNDSVRANIAYGRPQAEEDETIRASVAAYAHDFITSFPEGYDTTIGERGMRLSGGQRQRISIARAILKNPPILVLDEATSSLDTESEMLVQKALENLMENRTTFVIAHRLSTVRRADRIIVLDEGRIIEEGRHEELVSAGRLYKKLYDLQFMEEAEGAG